MGRRKALQKEKEPVWVVRTIPGRIRLRFRSDKADQPDLDRFLAIPGVEEVTFNKFTKSLLLLYSEKLVSKDNLLKEIEKEFPEVQLRLRSEDSDYREDNALSQILYSSASRLNQGTNKALKGNADLTSIVPTALLLWGIGELIRNPTMPRWYDILRAAESMLFAFKEK